MEKKIMADIRFLPDEDIRSIDPDPAPAGDPSFNPLEVSLQAEKEAIKVGQYKAQQEKIEELQFKRWYQPLSKVNKLPEDPDDPLSAYDFRSYYRDMKAGAADQPTFNADKKKYKVPPKYARPGHPDYFQNLPLDVWTLDQTERFIKENPAQTPEQEARYAHFHEKKKAQLESIKAGLTSPYDKYIFDQNQKALSEGKVYAHEDLMRDPKKMTAFQAFSVPYTKGVLGFFTRPFGKEPFGSEVPQAALLRAEKDHPVASAVGKAMGGLVPMAGVIAMAPETLLGQLFGFAVVGGVGQYGHEKTEGSLMDPGRTGRIVKQTIKSAAYAPLWYYTKAVQLGGPVKSIMARAGARGVGTTGIEVAGGASPQEAVMTGLLTAGLSGIFELTPLAVSKINDTVKNKSLDEIANTLAKNDDHLMEKGRARFRDKYGRDPSEEELVDHLRAALAVDTVKTNRSVPEIVLLEKMLKQKYRPVKPEILSSESGQVLIPFDEGDIVRFAGGVGKVSKIVGDNALVVTSLGRQMAIALTSLEKTGLVPQEMPDDQLKRVPAEKQDYVKELYRIDNPQVVEEFIQNDPHYQRDIQLNKQLGNKIFIKSQNESQWPEYYKAYLKDAIRKDVPAAAGQPEAIIWIGPPGSGKSQMAKNLALEKTHVQVDPDDAKLYIAETSMNPALANHVQLESAYMAETLLLERLLEQKKNIIWPKVGKNAKTLSGLASLLKKEGYKVKLFFNDLPLIESKKRAYKRYLENKRLVSADYIGDIGDNRTLPEIYEQVKNEFDEYAAWDVNVKFGESPRQIDKGVSDEGTTGSEVKETETAGAAGSAGAPGIAGSGGPSGRGNIGEVDGSAGAASVAESEVAHAQAKSAEAQLIMDFSAPAYVPGPGGSTAIQPSPLQVKFKKDGYLFFPDKKIESPADVAFAFKHLTNDAIESFFIITEKGGKVSGVELITVGTYNSASPAVYELLNLPQYKEADGIYCLHNHPSGIVVPSRQDKEFTNNVDIVLNRMGIRLKGHIIIDTEKFALLNADGTFMEFKHEEYAKLKKVPIFKKYFEWQKNKDLLGPSIKSAQDIYEIVKGVKTSPSSSIVALLDYQNRILGIYALPQESLTPGNLIKLGTSARGSGMILYQPGVMNQSEMESLRMPLAKAGINLLDDIRYSSAGVYSAANADRIAETEAGYGPAEGSAPKQGSDQFYTKEYEKYSDKELDLAAKRLELEAKTKNYAVRFGEVDPAGGYFATQGSSTYYDLGNNQSVLFDLSKADLVQSNTPGAMIVLKKALADAVNTPEDFKRIKEAIDAGGMIDYKLNDEVPAIVKAAKRIGHDGIKVWENDDVGGPSSVFIWNLNKVREIGKVGDLMLKELSSPVPEAPEQAVPAGEAVGDLWEEEMTPAQVEATITKTYSELTPEEQARYELEIDDLRKTPEGNLFKAILKLGGIKPYGPGSMEEEMIDIPAFLKNKNAPMTLDKLRGGIDPDSGDPYGLAVYGWIFDSDDQLRQEIIHLARNPVKKANRAELQKIIREAEKNKKFQEQMVAALSGKRRKFIQTVKDSPKTAAEVAGAVESRYDPISNEKTIEEAKALIEADYNAAVELVEGPGRPTRLSNAVAMLLIHKAQAEGRFADAIRMVEKTAEKNTEVGQTIQILATYNRLTPEGVLQYAEHVVRRAQKELGQKERIDFFTKKSEGIPEVDQQKLADKLGIPFLGPEAGNGLFQMAQKIRDGKFDEVIDAEISGFERVEFGKRVFVPNPFAKLAKYLLSKESAERRGQIATALMMRKVASLVPANLGKRISLWQTMAQLLNPKTIVRNLFGNFGFLLAENLSDTVGAGIDVLTALSTGERTHYMPGMAVQWHGILTGLREGTLETLLGVDLKKMNQAKFDVPKTVIYDKGFLGALEKSLRFVLGVPDRAFWQAAYNQSLRNSILAEKATEPSEEMIEKAIAAGWRRTFQDDNIITKQMVKLKKWMNEWHVAAFPRLKGWGFGDLVIKYPGTPSAILHRGIEYSPYSLFKVFWQMQGALRRKQFGRQEQKEFTEAASRGVVGTSLIVAGMILAAMGIVSGRRTKDRDVAALRESSGLREYQINIDAFSRFVLSGMDPEAAKIKEDDVLITYDWSLPMSMSVALGANIVLDPKGGWINKTMNIGESLLSAAETIEQQPMLQGLRALTGKQSVGEGVAETGQNLPSSFVPTLLNQVRQLTDNTRRNTKDFNYFKEAYNRIKLRIPGAAGTLPPRISSLGEVQEMYQGGSNNPFNVFLNPAFVSKYQPSPVAKMVLDIWENTGQTTHFPRVVSPGKIKVAGYPEPVELTPGQYVEFQKYIGNKTDVLFSVLAEDPSTLVTFNRKSVPFGSLEDDEKAQVLSNLLTQIGQAGRIEVLGSRPKNVSAGVKSILADISQDIREIKEVDNVRAQQEKDQKEEEEIRTIDE